MVTPARGLLRRGRGEAAPGGVGEGGGSGPSAPIRTGEGERGVRGWRWGWGGPATSGRGGRARGSPLAALEERVEIVGSWGEVGNGLGFGGVGG